MNELDVIHWTASDRTERSCPFPSDYDGKMRTCKHRECPRCGPKWALDWNRSMSTNLEAYGGAVVLVTITAPGSERLPWDEVHCSHRRSHKHRGPAGCRVQQRAAREWSDTLTWRWAKLRGAAQQATRRSMKEAGFADVGATILGRAYEPQKRGVPHLHPALGYRTKNDRHSAHFFVGHLKRLAPQYDFGFADGKGSRKPGMKPRPTITAHGVELRPMSGEEAANYVANYITGRNPRKKDSIRHNVAHPVMPRSLLWLTPKLTSKEEAITVDGRPTHVTMRLLRRARQLYGSFRGVCEAPKWNDVVDAFLTALVFRRAYRRGRQSDHDPPEIVMQLARQMDRDFDRTVRKRKGWSVWFDAMDEVTSLAYSVAGLEVQARVIVLGLIGAGLGSFVLALGFLGWSVELARRLEQRLQAGDVDADGEIVDQATPPGNLTDELRERLDEAIGESMSDVDRGRHLDSVLEEVARLKARPYWGNPS